MLRVPRSIAPAVTDLRTAMAARLLAIAVLKALAIAVAEVPAIVVAKVPAVAVTRLLAVVKVPAVAVIALVEPVRRVRPVRTTGRVESPGERYSVTISSAILIFHE